SRHAARNLAGPAAASVACHARPPGSMSKRLARRIFQARGRGTGMSRRSTQVGTPAALNLATPLIAVGTEGYRSPAGGKAHVAVWSADCPASDAHRPRP